MYTSPFKLFKKELYIQGMSVDDLRTAKFAADLADVVYSSFGRLQKRFLFLRSMPCKGLRHLEAIGFAQKVIIQCQHSYGIKRELQRRHDVFADAASAFEGKISHAASCAHAQCIDESISLTRFASACAGVHDRLMESMTGFSGNAAANKVHRMRHSVSEMTSPLTVGARPLRRLERLVTGLREIASGSDVPGAVLDTFAWHGPAYAKRSSETQGDTQTDLALRACAVAKDIVREELDFCWARNNHSEWAVIGSCWKKIRIVRDRVVHWMARVGSQFSDPRLRSAVGLACMLLDESELGFYSRPPDAAAAWFRTADPLGYLMLASIDEYMGWVFPFSDRDLDAESPVLLHLLSIHSCNFNSNSIEHMTAALEHCRGRVRGSSARAMVNSVRVTWLPPVATVKSTSNSAVTAAMDEWEASPETSELGRRHAESRVVFAFGREAVRALEPDGGQFSDAYDAALKRWEELFAELLSPPQLDSTVVEFIRHAVIMQLIISFCLEMVTTVVYFDKVEIAHCFQAAVSEADSNLEPPSASYAKAMAYGAVLWGVAGTAASQAWAYLFPAASAVVAASEPVVAATGVVAAAATTVVAATGVMSTVVPYAITAMVSMGATGALGVIASSSVIAGTSLAAIVAAAGVLVVYLIPTSLTQAGLVDQMAYAHPGIQFMLNTIPHLSILMGVSEFTYRYFQVSYSKRIVALMESAVARLGGSVDIRNRDEKRRLFEEMRDVNRRYMAPFSESDVIFPNETSILTKESVRGILEDSLPGSALLRRVALSFQSMLLASTIGFASYYFYTNDLIRIRDGVLDPEHKTADIAIRNSEFYLNLSVFSSRLVMEALVSFSVKFAVQWYAARMFRSAQYRLGRITAERSGEVMRKVAFRFARAVGFGPLNAVDQLDKMALSTAAVKWDLGEPVSTITRAGVMQIDRGIFRNDLGLLEQRTAPSRRLFDLRHSIDVSIEAERISQLVKHAEVLSGYRTAFESMSAQAALDPKNADLAKTAAAAKKIFMANLNQDELRMSLHLESGLVSAIESILWMVVSVTRTAVYKTTQRSDVDYTHSSSLAGLQKIVETKQEMKRQIEMDPALVDDADFQELRRTSVTSARTRAEERMVRQMTPLNVQQTTARVVLGAARAAAPYAASAGRKAVPVIKSVLKLVDSNDKKRKWLAEVAGRRVDTEAKIPEHDAFVFTLLLARKILGRNIEWKRVPQGEFAYAKWQSGFTSDDLLQIVTYHADDALLRRASALLDEPVGLIDEFAYTLYVRNYGFAVLNVGY